MLSRQNFRPFLLVGVGGQRDRAGRPGLGIARGWSPYAAAGVGFQAQLNDQWSVQADARAVKGWLRDDDKFGFDKSLNKYVSLSLIYAFNPPPRRSAAAGAGRRSPGAGTGTSRSAATTTAGTLRESHPVVDRTVRLRQRHPERAAA
jgi:hypothetical protein